ncbi:MAG: hypothetical protein HY288_16160 [Planctomycetia bacterium]|nr:hypothetical protein [Planctomycetia bacterium]
MLQNLANLNEIDLLPAEYRIRGVQRRTHVWRLLVILVFAWLFGSTTLIQHNQHASMRSKLAEVEAQYLQAAAHNTKSAEIKAQLQTERSSAELLTFLRHPWPRTQIMAAILEPLSDSITLTDWQILHEMVPRGTALIAPPSDAKKPPTDKPARRARDLTRLLQENAEQHQFVLLVGHATEAAALHEYLARLGSNPLFAKIDLRSIENVIKEKSSGQPTGTFHFTARAVLRPGYGQVIPSNPTTPSNTFTSGPLAQQRPNSEARQ